MAQNSYEIKGNIIAVGLNTSKQFEEGWDRIFGKDNHGTDERCSTGERCAGHCEPKEPAQGEQAIFKQAEDPKESNGQEA